MADLGAAAEEGTKDGEQPRGDVEEGGSPGTAPRPGGGEQQEGGGAKRKAEEQGGEPPKKSVSSEEPLEMFLLFTGGAIAESSAL